MFNQSNMISKMEYSHRRSGKEIGKGFTEQYKNGVVKVFHLNFLSNQVTEDIIYPNGKHENKTSKNPLKYWFIKTKLLFRR